LPATSRTLAGAGVPGALDGVGAYALFNTPSGLALAPGGGGFSLGPTPALSALPLGTLWVADTGSHRLRTVDVASGVTQTRACTGLPGFLDGDARFCQLNAPRGVAVAADGTVFVAGAAAPAQRRIRLSRPRRHGQPSRARLLLCAGRAAWRLRREPRHAGRQRPGRLRVAG
jgi:hypothetical protein